MKEQGIKQVFLPSDLIVLTATFVVGIVFLIMGDAMRGVGITVILCGALMAPIFRHGYRLDGQKGIFRQKEVLVSRECKKDIIAFLEGKSEVLEMHPRVQGGALVDIYYKKGSDKAFSRYFDYSDYASGTEYPLCEITIEKMHMLLA